MKTLHKKNLHNSQYDFKELTKSESSLKQYVFLNKYDNLTINFADPKAVMLLNKALLKYFYDIKNWEIPKNYLCPPIPGRADYIHYISDLLELNTVALKNSNIKVLDIGMGANCIYPILGATIYGWKFVGSDIDVVSIDSAKKIVKNNKQFKSKISFVLQKNKDNIFFNIINKNDRYDVTICNPPFHKSAEDANIGTKRKIKNLTKSKNTIKKTILNFAGQNNELWCNGGEITFIKKMITESTHFKNNCFWFTTLVSKKENLNKIYKELKKANVTDIKTIDMKQGQKISRIVAWTFLTKDMQNNWKQKEI